jgi:hypothetical protein
MIQSKIISTRKNNGCNKKIIAKSGGIIPSRTVNDSTEMQQTESSVITGVWKDVVAVAHKKTVRERVMKTIIKTKERLAASSRQQHRHHDGCQPPCDVHSAISIGEISIPVLVPCYTMSASNCSIKKLNEETLRIQKVRV